VIVTPAAVAPEAVTPAVATPAVAASPADPPPGPAGTACLVVLSGGQAGIEAVYD
jgi:hypothetical protein